ncbi:MAG TPA: YbaB/EbfC family nucleoid-associated protein [Campylobacterales bacterium]|nr:YbaB/EbfC family nucleoid-associated protein [Campylobacterales bacterium]
MFDNMDFSKMGDMLTKMQEEATKMQAESESKTFSSKSGGGMVKVTANGKSEIIDIELDDSLLEDKDSMQILLISAVNDVIRMIEEDKKLQATNMLGSLGGFGAKQ